jgi:predicted O-methyltransferase YrrM
MKQAAFILRFIRHFFSAPNTKGFGVHSPFLFSFTRFVLMERNPYYVFAEIENLRSSLLGNRTKINTTDLGTGTSGTKRISSIAKKSLSQKKKAQLLFRIGTYFKIENCLELGTSLGITSSYLGSISSCQNCLTIEGCPIIAKQAQNNFESLHLNNIKSLVGDISKVLPRVVENNMFDLIFIDANHQSVAVIEYVDILQSAVHESTVMIVDDIHWSKDMEIAWKYIKGLSKTTITIDLFYCGIVFFDSKLNKKHYKMIF